MRDWGKLKMMDDDVFGFVPDDFSGFQVLVIFEGSSREF